MICAIIRRHDYLTINCQAGNRVLYNTGKRDINRGADGGMQLPGMPFR